MKPIYIESIGIIAPGIENWQQAEAILAEDGCYQVADLTPLKPSMLKPNERRRTTLTIKLALQVVQDALSSSDDYSDLKTIFVSSDGDMDIVNRICQALTLPDHPVSPTFFHNSVHNAPAGYCSITTGFHAASTSLSGLNGSFSVGLLDAAVQATIEQQPVLLISYDTPWPEPLKAFKPHQQPFGVAMVVRAEPTKHSLAKLNLSLNLHGDIDQMDDSRLEQLRANTPAASSLPLLQSIIQKRSTSLLLPYLVNEQMSVEIEPCH